MGTSSPEIRRKILHDFAKWTAMRAVRGNALSSGKGIDMAFKNVRSQIEDLIGGKLKISTTADFDKWHKGVCETIVKRFGGEKVSFGWAAKVLNIYLKARVYIGGDGPPDLAMLIHPPIDNLLWKALQNVDRAEGWNVMEKNRRLFAGIGNIKEYSQYRDIIKACEALKEKAHCSLVELEQYWPGNSGQIRAEAGSVHP